MSSGKALVEEREGGSVLDRERQHFRFAKIKVGEQFGVNGLGE